MPHLERALTVELHFVKKVCRPTQSQFDRIHRAGLDAIWDIAQTYLYLQRELKSPETWPGPNEAIAEVLQQAVERTMPDEVADEYRAEIVARFDAAIDADAAAIVNLVDQQTILGPTQQEQLHQTIRQNWNPRWSRRNVVLLYPQYAQLPGADVLKPHLSERQQQLWSYRPEPRAVRLSWEVYLGTSQLSAAGQLEPFDISGPRTGKEEAK
jgi:hypothetical protein